MNSPTASMRALPISATRNVSVDVGYQYLSAPSAEYRDLASGAVKDGIDFHQLRVGLRYDLW